MIFSKAKRAEAARIERERAMNDKHRSFVFHYPEDSIFSIPISPRLSREQVAVIAGELVHGLFGTHDLSRTREALTGDEPSDFHGLQEVDVRGQDASFREVFCEGVIELSPPLYGSEVERSCDNARLSFRATMKIGHKKREHDGEKRAEDGAEDNGHVHKGSPNVEEGDVGVSNSTLRGDAGGEKG